MNLHKRERKHSTEELDHTLRTLSQKIKKNTKLKIVSSQGTPLLDQLLNIFQVCPCRHSRKQRDGCKEILVLIKYSLKYCKLNEKL